MHMFESLVCIIKREKTFYITALVSTVPAVRQEQKHVSSQNRKRRASLQISDRHVKMTVNSV